MIILSIIIPVYKVEKYIDGTLSSIYNQHTDENMFEVIVVNDGTPDNSMAIVDKFKHSHTNLTVISQSNQGLSVARNEGLRVAQGKYIWFVDSDDKIEDNILNKLLVIVKNENSDILGFGLTRINEAGSFICTESPFLKKKYYSLYGKMCSGKYLYHKINIGVVQRYIYSHSFLKKNSLSFYPGIWYEDEQFSVRAFFFAKNVKIINLNIYRYLVRSNGNIMSSVSMKSVYDSETIIKSWHDFSKENALNYKDKAIFYDAISEYCFYIYSFRRIEIPAYQNFMAKYGSYYRKLGLRSAIYSFRYLSRRKVLCVLAFLFIPSKLYKFY